MSDADRVSLADRKKLSRSMGAVLRRAQQEKRLTCGLLPAIELLQTDPGSVLFCILPQSAQGDSAVHHIHTVLLQAFCYENDIHIVKVDSAERVGGLLLGGDAVDCRCVLVRQPWTPSPGGLSDSEKDLVRWCDLQPEPVLRLPAI